MTKARSSILSRLIRAFPCLWSFSALTTPAGAAPAKTAPAKKGSPAKSVPARRPPLFTSKAQGLAPLTFSVQARITPTGANAGAAQTINAQVALNGPKARVQTNAGGQPVVVLYAPPYVYRILPLAKAGVRWKLSGAGSSLGAFDPQQLLRDPTQIRALMLAGGAKKTGQTQLKGVAAEVYEVKAPALNGGPKIQGIKVWLRRADALPLRLVANAPGVQVVATWSSYARPPRLPAALFTPPATYKIRDVASAPPLSGL